MTSISLDEYDKLDGLDMAALLAKGEVTPEELMACAIEVAKSRADLNALIYERYEESLALARSWKRHGVFGGIPFLLKDAGAAVRFPSSVGSRLLNDTVWGANSTLVDKFEQAGLIAFARTKVPEFCMGASTEAVNNGGPTHNPWDMTRSAGGSSGGAAAAVAARIVPIAHGNDGGGSIRIPAACCGVYGLKPSRGRVPMGPNRGEGWGGMSCEGVLTRTVRDTAATLDAIGGYEAGAPYAEPPKGGSYLDAISMPGAKLRIGVWRDGPNDVALAPQVLAALDRTATVCRELGHEVVELPLPDIDFAAFMRTHGTVLATYIVLTVDTQLKALGRSLADNDLEPVLRDGYEVGKSLSSVQYLSAIQHVHAVGRAMDKGMRDCDLVLTPALPQLPLKLGELVMNTGFWQFREKSWKLVTPYMSMVNASGQPAATIPLDWTPQGLPVSTQIIGRFGREDLVLRLSAQLEEAAPWAHRRPPSQ